MFFCFNKKVRKFVLFTHSADPRAPSATFVARKQRTAKNEGQRGSCSFRAARVFSVGLPSLSSESMTADSVRMIFEDVKNLVNKIDKNHNEMEEEVVTLDSGSDVSLLPKKTLEELRRIYFGLQIPKLPRWNTWSGRSQTCRTTCSLVCGWRLCSHVRLDGIWASTATIW